MANTTPRLRRLSVDHKKMKDLAERSPFMAIVQTAGEPPEEYLLNLKVKGIIGLKTDQTPRYGSDHRIRVSLGEGYPKEKPVFEMITKVWHPNIGWGEGAPICIGSAGDHGWAPSMGLDDIIVRIMRMIRYENFSCSDNYNMLAAEWADKHRNLFPLETGDLLEEMLDISIETDEPEQDDGIVIF